MPSNPVIPNRLQHDSIVEALCEFRFDTPDLPEIVVGRLVDVPQWAKYQVERLPASQIPSQIRRATKGFQHEPLIAFRSTERSRLVRVGERTLTLHVMPMYCGWDEWRLELHQAVQALFQKLTDVQVTRIGLRYVNAMTLERQLIEGLHSLDLAFSVAGESMPGDLNINYRELIDDRWVVVTRIANRSFVAGNLPPETTAVVDVDVSTIDGASIRSPDEAMAWLEHAHDHEKRAFFRLIPAAIVDKLRAD